MSVCVSGCQCVLVGVSVCVCMYVCVSVCVRVEFFKYRGYVITPRFRFFMTSRAELF